MIRRVLALVSARNLEFIRDRSTLGWNIALPLLLVAGLAAVFGNGVRPLFKVAVVGDMAAVQEQTALPYTDYFAADAVEPLRRKVARHQIDALLVGAEQTYYYNPESPKGAVLERMLQATDWQAKIEAGEGLRYIDWLLPGILGMNMMFSCLFGVGYVIVRYRKSGYLKRLNATPVTALDFMLSQVLSRLILIMLITVLLYVGTDAVFGFRMEGRYLDLLLLTTLGATAMVSMGLLVAARVSSEELAGGLLNLLTWPMMVLSEVWFSLDGAPEWIRHLSQALPLTQLLAGARAIMLDGAGLAEVWLPLAVLGGITVVCIAAGAASFRWHRG